MHLGCYQISTCGWAVLFHHFIIFTSVQGPLQLTLQNLLRSLKEHCKMTSVTCNPLCGDSWGVRVKLEFKLLQKNTEQWAFCKRNIPGAHSLKYNQLCREDELYRMIRGLASPFAGPFPPPLIPPLFLFLLLLFFFYVFVTRITIIKVNDSKEMCLEN